MFPACYEPPARGPGGGSTERSRRSAGAVEGGINRSVDRGGASGNRASDGGEWRGGRAMPTSG
ncbi:hypothetical protein KPATCC21470_3163 [Kitasatospora purpeofusca]